jgi:hypothetical protein
MRGSKSHSRARLEAFLVWRPQVLLIVGDRFLRGSAQFKSSRAATRTRPPVELRANLLDLQGSRYASDYIQRASNLPLL